MFFAQIEQKPCFIGLMRVFCGRLEKVGLDWQGLANRAFDRFELLNNNAILTSKLVLEKASY